MASYRAQINKSWVVREPSARALAGLMGLAPPVTLQRIAERLGEVETVTLTSPVHTDDGAPLNGRVTLELRSNGEYVFSGHMRATGFPSYHWGLQVWLETAEGPVITALKLGSVFGTDTPGPRQRSWRQLGSNPAIASAWPSLRGGQPVDYKLSANISGVSGTALDILKFAVTGIIANIPLGPAGWYILIGNELAGLHNELNSPDVLAGISVGAGTFLILGPFGLVPAVLAGAATTAIADIQHRTMTEEEIAFAQKVFGNKIRYHDVVLTDLLHPDGNKFCIPFTGNTMLMGLGPEAYHMPMTWRDPTWNDPNIQSSYELPGQVFVHELSHAWQITNRGPFNLICDLSGHYDYWKDPSWASRAWDSFNLEEQAQIVSDWFGPHQGDLDGPAAQRDDRFHFIRDYIRPGIT